MDNLRVFKSNEVESARLEAFAQLATASDFNKDSRFGIGTQVMYYDYGQNWKYTGLLTIDYDENSRAWQSVSPRDHELICSCDSFEKLKEMADYYVQQLCEGYITVDLYKKFE